MIGRNRKQDKELEGNEGVEIILDKSDPRLECSTACGFSEEK